MNDEWLSVGSLAAFVVLKIEIREKGRDHAGHGSFHRGGVKQPWGQEPINMMADAFGQTIRRWANG